jgi:ribosomal-protein-alanine N-acetyltransferase
MKPVAKSDFVYRQMQEHDLDIVMQIEPTIYSHPWTRGNFMDSLHAGHQGWVMMQREEIVGYAVVMVVLDEAHLLNISVAGPYQKQGLGRQLLAHLINHAKVNKMSNMYLEVRASNVAAIALYKKMGFMQTSLRRGYYAGEAGREDAILMGLTL